MYDSKDNYDNSACYYYRNFKEYADKNSVFMNVEKLTNKFVMWGEKRRLKKLRKALKNFAEVYNKIKPQLERLRTLYVYIDRLIETQDKEYAKHKGTDKATTPAKAI